LPKFLFSQLLASAGGTKISPRCFVHAVSTRRIKMHEIIYLIGLVVVVMFVLSLLGLR